MSALPEGYRLAFDPGDVDVAAAHAYLSRSYWATGIPLATVERALRHSLTCTVHDSNGQIGMARVISDYATFAYLADVYVLEGHRGWGIAQAMLGAVQNHPELQGFKHWLLFTRDAQSLYAKTGWQMLSKPEWTMMRSFPDVYS